ncbi:hypothetical protein AZE99_10065 [Sphingorhabdus sp. M41]|nr:hypothetical protein AZE99_10065 [Sphingorhabdus sp. M41]
MQFEAEAARQFALERYDVLDSAAEDCFDHITQAVKLALDVPSVGIAFLDGDRMWLKSKIGLAASEIPRDCSFSNYTIIQNRPTIIEDARQDARFKDNPVVHSSPFYRSYIGVPLVTPDGHNIGALCATDLVPRQYCDENVKWLERMAELVIHELELRQQAKKDRLTGALTRSGFAVEVQKAISLHERQGIKSTLVIFDVDLYKMVSKRFGSPSGNALLRSIIQPLVRRLRRSNYIGRLGGTQFAVLLTCTAEEKARQATENLRRELEQANTDIFFDVSFCEISPDMGVCEDWLEQANLNLLAAKKTTRDGICDESGTQYNMASGTG